MCNKPLLLSFFSCSAGTLDNVKKEECKQSFARVRGVERYKGKGAFKVNEGSKIR